MIEYGDKIYYIDLSAIDKIISLNSKDNLGEEKKETVTITYDANGAITGSVTVIEKIPKSKEIDPTKFTVINEMIDILMEGPSPNEDEEDFTLGVDNVLNKKSLTFKIAFNTLYKIGVLKEIQ